MRKILFVTGLGLTALALVVALAPYLLGEPLGPTVARAAVALPLAITGLALLER